MRKLKISYTPDLPDFIDKELMPPAEKYRIDKEADEKSRQASLKRVAEHNRKIDEYNATHPNDKKGYRAYGGKLPSVKFRYFQKYPTVIGEKEYQIEKDQAFPVYDSECMCIGNGFAFEMNELEVVNKDNVFEIYERDINHVERLVKDENGVSKWISGTRKNHIDPVPKNPILRFFKRIKLLNDYNNLDPFEKENPNIFRKTVKTGDFLAVNSSDAKSKMGSDGWHYVLPRRLSHPVIEDTMWGDKGPFVEANIVPQLTIPSNELVNYPMIDFGHSSVFREYPKGLDGEKMVEKEALDFKLGGLPCAVYNYMDRNGIIDDMYRSIDDKYEQIRSAQARR
jgi:hypothetical protein